MADKVDHVQEAVKELGYAGSQDALANIDRAVCAIAHGVLALVEAQQKANRIAARGNGVP